MLHGVMRRMGLLMATITAAADAQGTPAGGAARPGLDAHLRAIDAFVERTFAAGATAGLGVGVVVDGRLVYQRALGFADATRRVPATDSTLWYLASTSKSFTGFAIAMLEHDGVVDLSAPITTLLPRARWHADARPAELTLANFLAHTHGIESGPLVLSAAFTGVFGDDQYGELLQWSPPLPSRELSYSNIGYNVASMVIDAKRREGWKAYQARALFAPAGMHDTHSSFARVRRERIAHSHTVGSDGTFTSAPFLKVDATLNAAGGHLSTIADLARWTIVQMDSGRLDGRQVFPARAVARAQEMLGARDSRFAGFERKGWGMGWDLGTYLGERMVSRFGGYTGLRSHLGFLPAHRVGVVAQVNTSGASVVTDMVAAYVYERLLGRGNADSVGDDRIRQLRESVARQKERAQQAERAAANAPAFARALSAYAGRYDHPAYGTIEMAVRGDSLRMTWGALSGAVTVADASQERVNLAFPGGLRAQFVFEGSERAIALMVNGARLQRLR